MQPCKTITCDHLTLGMLRVGESARVRSLAGGASFLSRLVSFGFTPGARLQVVQNMGRGPLIVAVRDTRVALGRGEADKIVVERLAVGSDGADY